MSTPKIYPSGTSLSENIGYEWTKETGEMQVQTFEGEINEILNKYSAVKLAASVFNAGNIGSLGYEANRGRARFMIRYVRENKDIEELYGVDVLNDVVLAPYFSAMNTAQIIKVRQAAIDNTDEDATWTDLQKTLYKHLIFGQANYVDKQFVLRTSKYVSLVTEIAADLTNIGTVVPAPTLSANMNRLIATLPSGEWLQGPAQVEHLGRGRWREDEELQWAKKWSVIYGGTLFAP